MRQPGTTSTNSFHACTAKGPKKRSRHSVRTQAHSFPHWRIIKLVSTLVVFQSKNYTTCGLDWHKPLQISFFAVVRLDLAAFKLVWCVYTLSVCEQFPSERVQDVEAPKYIVLIRQRKHESLVSCMHFLPRRGLRGLDSNSCCSPPRTRSETCFGSHGRSQMGNL